MNKKGPEISMKNIKLGAPFDQKGPLMKNMTKQQIFTHCTLMHMTNSHNVVRSAEERFAMERTRSFGSRKIAVASLHIVPLKNAQRKNTSFDTPWQFSWLVSFLRRRVGKQTPAATQFELFTPKDLSVAQHFKDRRPWR